MPRCSNCGVDHDSPEGCPSCAAPVESVVTCPRCEEDYNGGDSCPACGFAPIPIPCDRHPHVLADGRCVICGRAICNDCRGNPSDKRVYLCDDHAAVVVIEGWAQVYDGANEVEAHLLRDNLAAEGIEARVFSQKDAMFSVGLGELSVVRILVPVWEHERAERIIQDHTDIEGAVSFACPNCGEAFDPGAELCLSCGASLIAGRGD